jgi:hypothetical protein
LLIGLQVTLSLLRNSPSLLFWSKGTEVPVVHIENANTPPMTINKNFEKILVWFSLLVYPGDTE